MTRASCTHSHPWLQPCGYIVVTHADPGSGLRRDFGHRVQFWKVGLSVPISIGTVHLPGDVFVSRFLSDTYNFEGLGVRVRLRVREP